jgi:hypothetical protein
MKSRFGFSRIFSFVVLAGLAYGFYQWPAFVDAKGSTATGSVTEKRETVRVNFGTWYRRFEIIAAFQTPGSPFVHHAQCDVTQPIYESLHAGDQVAVHYFPTLLQQPFIPATHLGPCTPAGNFGSNPALYRRLTLVFGSLAAILFAWLVLRIQIAGWLLVPWFGFFIVYAVVPRAQPAPVRPLSARATVRSVTTVDTLISGSTSARHYSPPLKLDHPFQLVQLEFIPARASEPVVALDSVDLNSIAGLAPKQMVDIDYDEDNPRIARIHGGTRHFPEQALRQLMTMYGAMAALLAALFLFRRLRPRRSRVQAQGVPGS